MRRIAILIAASLLAPAAAAQPIVASSDPCAALARSVPDAEYRPGVDARGQAVAPADLPGSAPRPALRDFPIEIQGRVASPAGPHNIEQVLRLGYVTVRDGRAYFNGQPLTADEQRALETACRR